MVATMSMMLAAAVVATSVALGTAGARASDADVPDFANLGVGSQREAVFVAVGDYEDGNRKEIDTQADELLAEIEVENERVVTAVKVAGVVRTAQFEGLAKTLQAELLDADVQDAIEAHDATLTTKINAEAALTQQAAIDEAEAQQAVASEEAELTRSVVVEATQGLRDTAAAVNTAADSIAMAAAALDMNVAQAERQTGDLADSVEPLEDATVSFEQNIDKVPAKTRAEVAQARQVVLYAIAQMQEEIDSRDQALRDALEVVHQSAVLNGLKIQQNLHDMGRFERDDDDDDGGRP